MSNLFTKQDIILHSGGKSDFKIECDDLSDASIETLAYLVSKQMEFNEVYGVPRGGLRFAEALKPYCSDDVSNVLIVDDVLTTGNSMETFAVKINKGQEYTRQLDGVVIFARQECPYWIKSIFQMW